jgi:hypothetical protein
MAELFERKTQKGRRYFEDRTGEIVEMECSGDCGEMKSVSDFHKNKSKLGGRVSICKECVSNYGKENKARISERNRSYYTKNRHKYKKYYKDNREYVLERSRRWSRLNRERHDSKRNEWREKNPEYNRLYYVTNYEKILKYGQKYQRKNREQVNGYKQKWKRNNRDKVLLYGQRRRARKSGLIDDFTIEQHAEILMGFNGCSLTEEHYDIHMDHVIPLSTVHGGTTYGNMIPLRSDLNISKGYRNIFEWFNANRERFGLSQAKFDALIEWLAEANEMTVDEYRDYVYWCHANPRELNESEAN